MSALPDQLAEIEQAGVHVMLTVGVDSEGSTKIRRVNGTQWDQLLLDRVREAVELVHEEIMGEEERISFVKKRRRKKSQWWPDLIECCCGHVIRFVQEPEYLLECPSCGYLHIISP